MKKYKITYDPKVLYKEDRYQAYRRVFLFWIRIGYSQGSEENCVDIINKYKNNEVVKYYD